jgi:hypothetical protein
MPNHDLTAWEDARDERIGLRHGASYTARPNDNGDWITTDDATGEVIPVVVFPRMVIRKSPLESVKCRVTKIDRDKNEVTISFESD